MSTSASPRPSPSKERRSLLAERPHPSLGGGRVLGRGLKDLISMPISALEISRPTSFGTAEAQVQKRLPRVLVVSSGKGGTGKSFLSVNLACGLAQLDQQVLIIDADFGLANVHLLLGLYPRHDISLLIRGRCAIGDVLVDGPPNIRLLGGCSGIAELSQLTSAQFHLFVSEIMKVERDFDWVIVDTSAGISPQVMSFLTAAKEALLVVNPEATSMLDAYAMMKTLFFRNPTVEVGFIANRVKDSIVAKEAYKKLNGAVENYLKKSMIETGFVVLDAAVGQSLANRRPIILDNPTSNAALCVKKIVQKIIESNPGEKEYASESYFSRLRKEVSYWQHGRIAAKGGTHGVHS